MDWPSVYVIAADNGEVKIGYARAPVSRFVTIQREYGPKRGFLTARLVGYVEAVRADALEALAHRQFWGTWVGGEWFQIDPDAALDRIERLWAELAGEYALPACRSFRFSDQASRLRVSRGRLVPDRLSP